MTSNPQPTKPTRLSEKSNRASVLKMENNRKNTPTSRVLREIDLLIRSRYPILYLVTYEEGRLEDLLYKMASSQGKELYTWTATRGMARRTETSDSVLERADHNDPIEALDYIQSRDVSGLFLLKDFHPFLEDPHVVRLLRDLAHDLKNTYKSVIIAAPRLNMPPELEKDITIIDFPLPDTIELGLLLHSVCRAIYDKNPDAFQLGKDDVAALVRAAQGLTLTEAENAFAKAAVTDGRLCRSDIEIVQREKQQIIRKSGILEFHPPEQSMADVGGLDELKRWLGIRGKAFAPGAAEFGLPAPNGVLLLGAPGCGKSLTAKAVGHSWGLPLLRLDLGRIYSGLVGSSEENMRRALKVAEGVAPAVMWIDELEKGLAGGVGGSGLSDGGTASRVFGTLLTWMQENEARVFVVATANRIAVLPPELLRRGRFDEIFFVDLPQPESREEIFRIHLQRRKRDPESFDLEQLVRATEGFSGAEIEHCVIEGLFLAFDQERELNDGDLLRAAAETVPLSVTSAEELRRSREWASKRARPAERAVRIGFGTDDDA